MVQIPNQQPNQQLTTKSNPAEVTPTPPTPPIAEVSPVLPVSPDSEEPEPLLQKRSRHASANSTRIILSIVLLSIVFLLGALYVAIVLRSSPEEPPKPQPPQSPPVVVKPSDPPEQPVPPDPPEDSPASNDPEDEEPVPEIPEINDIDDQVEESEPDIDGELLDLPPLEPEPTLVPQPIQEREVIDVSERLQLPIAGLKAERTTLYDAATVLADYAGVPLTWDVPGMRLFGISLDKSLRLDFGESTVGEMLESLLSQNQLAMLVEHGQIFIYPIAAADPTLSEVRYDIADLGSIVEIIPHLIAPFSWESLGGAGSLVAEETTLVVNQTEFNHREIARFLEMVREARKIPLLSTAGKTPQETERILRELFPERYCEETLDKPLTFHYITPTPLTDVFRILGPPLNLRFLVNHRTLNEAYTPFAELKGTVHVEKGTVHEAIVQLLHSVDQVELTYRIVDENTLEIITRDAALLPEYWTLESHHYGAVLREQADLTAEEMIAMLKNTIEPESWAETTLGGGVILVDHASETFFIRQSQPVQRIVHEWLFVNRRPSAISGQ